MRSLILGATGLIGSALVDACERRGDAVLGTWYRRPHHDFAPLDICDEANVIALVEDFQPDAIYLAAGLNQIDFAEAHPDECRAVNEDGAAVVAEAAARCGATLIAFSTAHVFGECRSARREEAPVEPFNAHGRSAARAEDTIRDLLPHRHLILRTNWVYGPEERGKNPAVTAIRRLADDDAIETTAERHCQPTYAPDLAEAAIELARRETNGTIHAVGPDRVTEYSFHQTVAFVNGFDCDRIVRRTIEELEEDAPRPRSPWLDRLRLRAVLGSKAIRALGDGLRAMRDLEVPLAARAA
ncbi:MAG: sugar nucleotide-binding protein [Planctomycetia bacterium]|nr:sugar nucleotide-binding protein [Planctomycetia bacterium]